MKTDRLFLVYRVYSAKERPDTSRDARMVFYGWTYNKNVIKALFTQRDKSKYYVVKTDKEEIGDNYAENMLEYDSMIDYIPLKFASTKEEIKFFTTKEEMQQAEIRIQRMFREMCNLVDRDKGNIILLTLFMNLKDYYAFPLEYIGFQPPEINDLFQSMDAESSLEDIEDLITDGYSSALQSPYEEIVHSNKIPGLTFLGNTYLKILYSVESFIKVLKEDL